MHEALAKGNRNSHAVGRAGGFGCVAFAVLMLAAAPAKADRPDEAAANPAAVATTRETVPEATGAAPARNADRLLELVVAYLDNAFDAGRRAHRDVPRDAAAERVAADTGQ